ncbi:MAG TPA: hypothetical protein ENK18_23255 [Deltaproteobacteria bacterium]|nr:hypothetical protein [Deltaproteobacteria bacterium]
MERRRRRLLTLVSTSLVLALSACVRTDGAPELVLDGPARVRVDRLGPIEGPRILLDNGSEPHGVIWSLSEDGVARLDGAQLVAVGSGEVQVVGEWEDQRIEWTLVVELATLLSFVDAPARIPMGSAVDLIVEAHRGDEPIPVGAVQWITSDPRVLRVLSSGRAEGRTPGTVYVTARARGAQAMVEIEVVE